MVVDWRRRIPRRTLLYGTPGANGILFGVADAPEGIASLKIFR
ncbi:hypothetical protein [Nostoc sp.]